MYVLLEGREYEGYCLLGVYSTLELAQAAGQAYCEAHGLRWSWVEVQYATLDGGPVWRNQEACLWSLTQSEEPRASA